MYHRGVPAIHKLHRTSWISEEVLTYQSATAVCVLLIILKVIFWQRYKDMNPSTTRASSRFSQFTFLGMRKGFKACILSIHHIIMYRVWKPYNIMLTHLTDFELDQNYVIITQVFWCAISLILMFMAKCMAQYGAYQFRISNVAKCLPWCESSLHGKCSTQYQYSTCASLDLCSMGKRIDLCSKQAPYSLHLLFSILLIISGDIELNPGPKLGKL